MVKFSFDAGRGAKNAVLGAGNVTKDVGAWLSDVGASFTMGWNSTAKQPQQPPQLVQRSAKS